jgi:predicted DsbA family dithiol-disulfide isomerase
VDIQIWSDIICPYCGLMDNRLRLVMDRFEHADDVHVVHRSFQIHPDLPRGGITQRQLLETHGIPPSHGEQLFASIEGAARREGLEPYHALERTLGPTDYAHELLAYATDKGRGGEVWAAMFRAHFGASRKLWTKQQVLDFADEIGLDHVEAAEVLRDRRYQARVAADQHAAERLGARGTPFIVLGGTYALAGAVSTEELLAAMTEAWKASRQALQIFGEGEGEGACGQDRCSVPSLTS